MTFRAIFGQVKNHKRLVENFSYISLLQLFLILSPLITYPYLIRVLGQELYGWVITAQVLVSYAVIIINFGTDSVCAKHVAVNRNDREILSEIVCSVLFARLLLWLLCLLLLVAIIFIVPSYRSHMWLFLLTFGQTSDILLFPQYFFQGVEKMKYSSLINISVKLFFVCLVFVFVKRPSDYLFIPLLYSIGHLLAGVVSILILKKEFKIDFYVPSWSKVRYYLKDSSPLFITDIICTIKDKLNYFILGGVNMGDVVVYDLGTKMTAMLSKPGSIIATVFFPQIAYSKDKQKYKKILLLVLLSTSICVAIVNIFMAPIVEFMLHKQIDLLPLRLFSLAPLFLSVSSYIYSNCYVAFGHSKFALYSIVVTTAGYLTLLCIMSVTNNMRTIFNFVILAVASYLIELIYRIISSISILKEK